MPAEPSELPPSTAAPRRTRRHALNLIAKLKSARNILITTHQHPDPDALASVTALAHLLRARLPKEARVTTSVKGQLTGGINERFARLSDLKFAPWDQSTLDRYDAVLLTDVQPPFPYNPLPAGVKPFAVIDHHRTRGRRPACPFCDIRPDVGSTTSIIYSYFRELDLDIPRRLAATMLYAIESDLAGAAGQPSELDTHALAGLTLQADTALLYRMRYADLPQAYFQTFSTGLAQAKFYEHVLVTHLDFIDTLEKPAVLADFLLRFDQVQYVLVTANFADRLVLSLRTSNPKVSAADLIRRVIRGIGEGGGHRAKAGGYVPLTTGTPAELDRKRTTLRTRLLRAVGIAPKRGKDLVKGESKKHEGTEARRHEGRNGEQK